LIPLEIASLEVSAFQIEKCRSFREAQAKARSINAKRKRESAQH
jgi:hypothetical protein